MPLNQTHRDISFQLSSLDAVVFDCDGVLLDTVGAKLRAFQSWVPSEFAHLRSAFGEYNKRAFGINRYEQIRYFFEHLAGESVTDGRIQEEAGRFGKLVADESRNTTWLPGSREFIQRLHEQKIPLYVLSGTPEEELKENLRQQQGAQFFLKIIGAPMSKEEGLRLILDEGCHQPEKTWFVGDADRDFAAARHAGVHFIYKPSEVIVSDIQPEATVEKLTDLLR